MYADRTALEQVITNLPTNASEALDQGLSEGDRKPRVSLSLTTSDQTAVIRVKDNGVGVPRDPERDL